MRYAAFFLSFRQDPHIFPRKKFRFRMHLYSRYRRTAPETAPCLKYDIFQRYRCRHMLKILQPAVLLYVRKISRHYQHYPCPSLCSGLCPGLYFHTYCPPPGFRPAPYDIRSPVSHAELPGCRLRNARFFAASGTGAKLTIGKRGGVSRETPPPPGANVHNGFNKKNIRNIRYEHSSWHEYS